MTPETASSLAIDAQHVTKTFGRRVAVSDFSLAIPRGSTFGFLGANGEGKTTTLKMLMGLHRPTSGSISVLGLDTVRDSFALKQRVGYVPEQPFIHRWMRVGQVINFCRAFYPTWNDTVTADFVKLLGLDLTQKVGQLSKGMQMKLSLVLAVAHEPEVLILDEPMAGLDPVVREELVEAIVRAVSQRERTVVLSSHTLSDVQRMADRIGIIHEGRLLVNCPVEQLVTGTKRLRAILKDGASPGAPPATAICQRVQNREWLLTVRDFSEELPSQVMATNPVEHVEVQDLGLEDIFKDYVRGWRASA